MPDGRGSGSWRRRFGDGGIHVLLPVLGGGARRRGPAGTGVFAATGARRRPRLRAGREIPPWDVVRTVLRDVAVNSGAGDVDPGEAGRAYALHRAALAAEDAAPGAEARLRARLAAATGAGNPPWPAPARPPAPTPTTPPRPAARPWPGPATN